MAADITMLQAERGMKVWKKIFNFLNRLSKIIKHNFNHFNKPSMRYLSTLISMMLVAVLLIGSVGIATRIGESMHPREPRPGATVIRQW